jgi:hypothetical protein
MDEETYNEIENFGHTSSLLPEDVYNRIAEEIHSDDSPVGIDAKKTHIMILDKSERIEKRLERLEKDG